jgi:hypothetical protein
VERRLISRRPIPFIGLAPRRGLEVVVFVQALIPGIHLEAPLPRQKSTRESWADVLVEAVMRLTAGERRQQLAQEFRSLHLPDLALQLSKSTLRWQERIALQASHPWIASALGLWAEMGILRGH